MAAYENGTKSPTWHTVEQLADSAHAHVDVRFFPLLTREGRRSLLLHAAIAERLCESSDIVLARARS